MKNLFVISCLLIISFKALLYADRLTIIEQMATTDCTSCAERSEYIYDLIDNSNEKAIALIYYKDLMVTSDGNTRCTYYGWGYYGLGKFNGRTPPNGIGEIYPDDVYHIDSNTINDSFAVEANFEFVLNSTITGTNPHSCDLQITAKSLVDYSSTGIIRMHVAIIENDVNYQQSTGQPPGNGQEVHHYVCRKMLPSGSGSYVGDQTVGKENTFTFSYTNDEAKQNYEKIRIVSFVQDYGNKVIIGSYISPTHPFQDITPIIDKEDITDYAQNRTNRLTIIGRTKNILKISIPSDGEYYVSLYSADGRLQRIIINEFLTKGNHEIDLDTKGLARGVFFIELRSGSQRVSQKFLLY